ncbi:hypothetical protein Hypma_010588 [Hypsizygus marmoreus]|uniref:Uncharacterized protein n=1 Tax=Hypsizygus marmoreus TaxID=39966 RepID=A0A369JLF8_HYPMA|nr:hypothetical protein Hypma_010588 [Hypsizygus marmoreus]
MAPAEHKPSFNYPSCQHRVQHAFDFAHPPPRKSRARCSGENFTIYFPAADFVGAVPEVLCQTTSVLSFVGWVFTVPDSLEAIPCMGRLLFEVSHRVTDLGDALDHDMFPFIIAASESRDFRQSQRSFPTA